MVLINDTLQFNGYISSKQQSIQQGTKVYNYQLIGKTYDLWRYSTDDYALYSGTTAYIASSLVSSYCTDVSGAGVDITDGVDLTNDIDLTNMTVGDAIVELSKLDGYSFYVDTSGDLQYYFSQSGIYSFSFEEGENTFEMSPIEESDADIINDVKVIGGSDYSYKTNVSPTHPHNTAFPSGLLVAQGFEAEDNVLSAVKVYLNRSPAPNPPGTLPFEIWENTEKTLFTDGFDNYDYLIEGGSNNLEVSGSQLVIEWNPSPQEYWTNGDIESICYSGVNVYDCQYMKLTLTDLVSSNNIFISGTADSGNTWVTLTNDVWTNMEDKSGSAVKVKYLLSSNLSFTPKIGQAVLTISDNSGGFEEILFTDTFSDNGYLSSNTNISTQVIGGYLEISGVAATGAHVTPSGRSNESTDGSWHNASNMIDNNWDSYAYLTRSGYTNASSIDIFTLPSTTDLYGVRLKMGAYQSNAGSQVRDIWISSSYTDGWLKVRDASVAMGGISPVTKVITFEDTYKYYKDVSKIKIHSYYYNTATLTGYLYEIDAVPFVALTVSGSIMTSSQISLIDSHYLKADVTGDSLNYITLSGSCDNGAHWTSIPLNTKTNIPDYGKTNILWYNLKPWHITGSKYLNTPRINSCILTSYGIQGGGSPKSGSIVEWSDDISFIAGDVPYPPSYSEWQSYSTPKLSGLTTGDNYWMIFEYPSSNLQWWKYYYNSTSTYNGGISYSWDNGVNWSSSTICPELVPDGDMTFQLGWTQGDITATATNQTSIDNYGRHFKKITESNYTTIEQAQARADYEISGMENIPMKGTVTIDGRTDISTEYRFSSNLTNFGIDDLWDIKSYTQRIDKNGFTTTISYGRHQFDLGLHIARLEREVY